MADDVLRHVKDGHSLAHAIVDTVREALIVHIGPEALAVDWTIENPWGLDTITPQGGEEGHCLPVTVWDLCREPPASRAPTSDGSHVGLDPGFIDEDETGRINPRLIFFPTRPAARHVGAILLGRQHAFF